MNLASILHAASTLPAALPATNQWSDYLQGQLWLSIQQTLQMVLVTLAVGGAIGLMLGIALFGTRREGILANRAVYGALNFIVNFIRPIPFIVFLAAIRPVTWHVMGTSIGTTAAIFPMTVVCAVATSRIVEQSLISVDPGLIEAGRAMGASRLHILTRIVVPEALGPLILGYAFLFVGVLDMSAMAGVIGAGGLGHFAISDGFNKYNDWVTWVAVAVLIILVQIVQQVGNALARVVLRHRR
jgi:D-methionine transport system permease protein